ncbi:putative long chain fatty alcohol oxidase [Lineolata rhizophorae]|uniref:Long-chain-alcohol oxidase n=1 Tax=Lineolata rhizophorae TaxID=578093 RepID=A0A6A6PD74_9PEZI|nr:putative long chain fatty alcohol oxidase [Lineolata rhizophorae]
MDKVPSVTTSAPAPSPLPPLSTADPLTAEQWRTFLAIADAVVPSIVSEGDPSSTIPVMATGFDDVVGTLARGMPKSAGADAANDQDRTALARDYLAESASSNPGFKPTAWRMLAQMPADARKQLTGVLNLLNSRPGSLLFTGYATPIADQPVHVREAIVQSWNNARLQLFRQLGRSFSVLSKVCWLKSSQTLNRIVDCPDVPVDRRLEKSFDFEFIQIPANQGSAPEVLETDVVIVGSGCGGAVCAKNLAEAGHKVIVVDKGYHWSTDHFPMGPSEALEHLHMEGGSLLSEDNCAFTWAGQAWGGGGVINWAVCLQTQGFVRKEWAEKDGLPFFTSAEYQSCLDRVCNYMGASTEGINHNKANAYLLEGARKLGWAHNPCPINSGARPHWCGYCGYGCSSSIKQGTVVTWLPDAARAGAKFIEGFDVEKMLFEDRNGMKTAVGVQGTWTQRTPNTTPSPDAAKRPVIIKASRVILSAGTMQSPLVLLRSGINNPQLGRNLHIHPVIFMIGVYDEDVKSWEGPIVTAVVQEFENLDGKGHGAKIENMFMVPNSFLGVPLWTGGLDHKMVVAKLPKMIAYFSLCRDRDGGQVYPDPADGRTRFRYTTSTFDREHILQGLIGAAKIHYVNGAREIICPIPGLPVFRRDDAAASSGPDANTDAGDPGINDPAFQAWLGQLRARGLPHGDTFFGSAHQMGTCRMSATPRRGVVDPHGKVWGTDGLFVADASVFPSASGVNPMVTNMAISDWISRGVSKGIGRAKAAGNVVASL